ncbi:MAG: response regulator [Deltaproteobacteria bacterium]|nr:response regulator [Deltaproteobacteria bacterium]
MQGPIPFFINGIIYLIFLVAWITIWRLDRQPYLRWWIAAYTTFTAYYFLAAVKDVGLVPPSVEHVEQALMLMAAGFLVVGVYRFTERRVPRWILVALSIPAIFLLLSSIFRFPYEWGSFVIFPAGALVLAGVGWSVLSLLHHGTGRVIAAFGFWALALWALALPFFGDKPFFDKIEPYGDLLFILMISIGVVLMHFERAREARQQVAAHYASLFTSAPVGLFRIDGLGRMVQVNPTLCAILGVSPLDEGVTLGALGYDDAVRTRLSHWLEGRIDVCAEEVTLNGADGQLRTILELRWAKDEVGKDWADGVLQDMTVEYALRERVERGQRVEALGRLAGGIAHDFNNILTVVISSLDLARFGCEDAECKHLNRAMDAAERAAKLTRKLLSLARQPLLRERGVVDINQVVIAEFELLERALGETIKIHIEGEAIPFYVRADPSELSQIIINLVLNARDAMPDGGTVSISLSATKLGPTDGVCLTVRDTGHGMDDKTRAKIFDPFFTTKGLGEGTGLGLSTVYGIIQALGGEITVHSKVGEGAAFEIRLPVGLPSSENVEEETKEEAPPQMGTILVVEDEPGVRLLAEQILNLVGHEVRGASSAEEALELLADDHVDLLLTDVVLPRMSGPELAAKLEPQVSQVLYMSGYTKDRLIEKGLEGAGFLPKPFTAELLRNAVNEAMKEAKSS